MQESAVGLTMWEDRNSTHDRSHRVSIEGALMSSRHEEGSLSTLELVIEVEEECIHGALLLIFRRRIVHVGVVGQDTRRRPSSVNVASVFSTRDISVHSEAAVDASY